MIKNLNHLIKNYGKEIFMKILLEMKKYIQKFLNILKIIFSNGKKINFITQKHKNKLKLCRGAPCGYPDNQKNNMNFITFS